MSDAAIARLLLEAELAACGCGAQAGADLGPRLVEKTPARFPWRVMCLRCGDATPFCSTAPIAAAAWRKILNQRTGGRQLRS
jgi:hypothetical protein